MRFYENPIGAWHDGEYAIVWLDTPAGLQLLNATGSLPFEVRQNLLRGVVSDMRPYFESGVNPNAGQNPGMLIYPLANVSPFIAELPAEKLIVFKKELATPDTPMLDPESTVRAEAALAMQSALLEEES